MSETNRIDKLKNPADESNTTDLACLEKLKKWSLILESTLDESEEAWQKANLHLMRRSSINLEGLILTADNYVTLTKTLAVIFRRDPHLQHVNLSGTRFSREQMEVLAKELQAGKNGAKNNIEELILRDCNLAEIYPLLEAMKDGRCLAKVDLQGTLTPSAKEKYAELIAPLQQKLKTLIM